MRYPKGSLTHILAALAGFVCLVFTNQQAAADEAPNRFLRVPVFFITDRNLQPTKSGEVNFGPHRKYIGDCKHDPFMGSAYCVVENIDRKPLNPHLRELGWSEATATDRLGAFKASPITDDNFDKIQKRFYDEVHARTIATGDKNLFIFVHGYKNTFNGALGTAAKLAYDAERPLILYSWPSVAKLRSYTSDENNVEWSQEHFNDFVLHLEQLCSADPSVKVRLFAHSMGTRLVIRATPFLAEKKYLVETALICPDIDDGLVKHYARRYLSTKGTTEIRLYMSRRDKALALSQVVHGGYTRLGEQADALGGLVTKALSGRKITADQQDTKAEDAEFAERLAMTRARMQTIDFTDIDKGMVGHSVPDKLICNMSFTGAPGAGLELVPENSGQRSKISNMFTRLAKLKSSDDSALSAGSVLHVIKDGSSESKGLAKAVPQPTY